MEKNIKFQASDITFMSELILDIEDVKDSIRPNNLRCTSCYRKLWAH